MTNELIEQCRIAGLTQDEINALQEYHAIRAAVQGGKGGTAVSITSTKSTKRLNTTTAVVSSTDHEIIRDLAYTLFGGFGPGQIRYLLRFADAKTIVSVMYQLRRESWARGWVRTRDCVMRLKVA